MVKQPYEHHTHAFLSEIIHMPARSSITHVYLDHTFEHVIHALTPEGSFIVRTFDFSSQVARLKTITIAIAIAIPNNSNNVSLQQQSHRPQQDQDAPRLSKAYFFFH